MSEYQYYEFQALDRPLTEHEMRELRSCSSRATVTSTRFVNHYEWGNFKGDSSLWMEKYFDAFLYLASWGTHELVIRLPKQLLDLKLAKQYCCGRAASARVKGNFVILELLSEDDGDDDVEEYEGSGRLSSLILLRADLASGDHRMLYLAWLLCLQAGELEDDAVEPLVPAGLDNLTASLRAFADFLRIDDDLITVAASHSLKKDEPFSPGEITEWVAALPDAAKTRWLIRLAEGKEPHLRAEFLQRFRDSRPVTSSHGDKTRRTVRAILAEAERLGEKRRQREAERAAAERIQRERQEADARERHFTALAKRETKAWLEVDALIATKQPGRYDEAVKLLCDLRDLGLQRGRASEVEARLLRLCEEHAKKPSFLERMRKAGLAKVTS